METYIYGIEIEIAHIYSSEWEENILLQRKLGDPSKLAGRDVNLYW